MIHFCKQKQQKRKPVEWNTNAKSTKARWTKNMLNHVVILVFFLLSPNFGSSNKLNKLSWLTFWVVPLVFGCSNNNKILHVFLEERVTTMVRYKIHKKFLQEFYTRKEQRMQQFWITFLLLDCISNITYIGRYKLGLTPSRLGI